jgi:hypothetical protein
MRLLDAIAINDHGIGEPGASRIDSADVLVSSFIHYIDRNAVVSIEPLDA